MAFQKWHCPIKLLYIGVDAAEKQSEKNAITIIIVFWNLIADDEQTEKKTEFKLCAIKNISYCLWAELEKTKMRKTNEKEMMSFNPIKLWYMRARARVCVCACSFVLLLFNYAVGTHWVFVERKRARRNNCAVLVVPLVNQIGNISTHNIN